MKRNRGVPSSLPRKLSRTVLLASIFLSSIYAKADFVRITAINGSMNSDSIREVSVHPGDLIQFSADAFDELNGNQSRGLSAENFIWSANDREGDVCDTQVSEDCLKTSNFQFNDYGISFYVPDSMKADVMVTVRGRDLLSSDQVLLHFAGSLEEGELPTQPITDASQYSYQTLDPDRALAGQGNWIVIGGVRHWVPYTYLNESGEAWAPYQNGYWAWDDEKGTTWISYDPWGWMTDHYGVWRHHQTYGWIWRPFADLHYEAYCSTWFDDSDQQMGWYPYYPSNSSANSSGNTHSGEDIYAQGYDDGFDDGYWLGYSVANGYGSQGYN